LRRSAREVRCIGDAAAGRPIGAPARGATRNRHDRRTAAGGAPSARRAGRCLSAQARAARARGRRCRVAHTQTHAPRRTAKQPRRAATPHLRRPSRAARARDAAVARATRRARASHGRSRRRQASSHVDECGNHVHAHTLSRTLTAAPRAPPRAPGSRKERLRRRRCHCDHRLVLNRCSASEHVPRERGRSAVIESRSSRWEGNVWGDGRLTCWPTWPAPSAPRRQTWARRPVAPS